jgi:hypothetical protein
LALEEGGILDADRQRLGISLNRHEKMVEEIQWKQEYEEKYIELVKMAWADDSLGIRPPPCMCMRCS